MKNIIGDSQVLIKDSKAMFGFRETKVQAYKRKKNTLNPLMDLMNQLMEAVK